MWALAGHGVGALVASAAPPGDPAGSTARRLLDALADAVALTTPVTRLAPGAAAAPVEEVVREAGPGSLVLVARDLGGTGTNALRRGAARAVVRAISDRPGLAMLATIDGDGLKGVLDRLRGLTVAAPDDEIVRLGVVLVLGTPGETTGRPRVVAAHYLRVPTVGPLGRIERRGPAVLATWDAARGTWDDFAWGIVPELAERIGTRPADLSAAISVRSETIEALLSHGLRGSAAFAAAARLALGVERA